MVELVDAPGLGSGVLCGVWVRVPSGALAACVGLLIIEDHASVAELADALDLGSSVLRGVWVRLPPGALAAEVFGVSSCRSRSTRVMMGGTWLAGLVQFGRTPVL